MKTLVFFLLLGQADGDFSAGNQEFRTSPGGLSVIPIPYQSHDACQTAGEAARENNVGLSWLSYTCVPAEEVQP